MNKEFLKLSVENIEFDLESDIYKRGFYWRVKIDEGDDNPIYYSDYLANGTMFELYNKLKEYFNE